MKAFVRAKSELGLWLCEEPLSAIGLNDVLIRVKKAAICDTDIDISGRDEWARKTIPLPRVVGHELAGEIVDPGLSVRRLVCGQRVSAESDVIACTVAPLAADTSILARELKGSVSMPSGIC
ncbi:D-arabinose 1-dehydrogenase-like Zn-dependent alcohol dehydrogenase [Bradyrhizobium yuanmingense]|uniref:alcohol dehydrogenase catalytic domain-containing protein n=1 Tax=Bradyrhizobium yuanmingense TaxID=108015 RepID=UPI003517E0E1